MIWVCHARCQTKGGSENPLREKEEGFNIWTKKMFYYFIVYDLLFFSHNQHKEIYSAKLIGRTFLRWSTHSSFTQHPPPTVQNNADNIYFFFQQIFIKYFFLESLYILFDIETRGTAVNGQNQTNTDYADSSCRVIVQSTLATLVRKSLSAFVRIAALIHFSKYITEFVVCVLRYALKYKKPVA